MVTLKLEKKIGPKPPSPGLNRVRFGSVKIYSVRIPPFRGGLESSVGVIEGPSKKKKTRNRSIRTEPSRSEYTLTELNRLRLALIGRFGSIQKYVENNKNYFKTSLTEAVNSMPARVLILFCPLSSRLPLPSAAFGHAFGVLYYISLPRSIRRRQYLYIYMKDKSNR